jgi:hypothetical protein
MIIIILSDTGICSVLMRVSIFSGLPDLPCVHIFPDTLNIDHLLQTTKYCNEK